MSKVICIGMPVYNGAEYLSKALDSLLAQTHDDFYVIAVDDCSIDNSYEILESYAKQDRRVVLFKNASRLGLIANWNKTATLSGELYDPDYFAWYSDHDWVEPDWLSNLFEVLEEDASVVLAHPITVIVDAHGKGVIDTKRPLDTTSMLPIDALRSVTLDYYGAGDVIYGLFRYDVLRKIGFFPDEILPDRLVVSEACLFGTICNVATTYRYRRNLSPKNYANEIISRQLASLFPPEQASPSAPILSHGIYFLRRFMEAPVQEMPIELRVKRLMHAYLYLMRQYNKYAANWEKEYLKIKNCQKFLPYSELVSFVLDGKWIPLTHDANTRLKEYKLLCTELRKKQAITKKNLLEESDLRKAAQSRVSAYKSLNDKLRKKLLAKEDQVKKTNDNLKEVNAKYAQLQESLNEKIQELSDKNNLCDKNKAREKSLKKKLDKLQNDFLEIEKTLLVKTDTFEDVAKSLKKSKEYCSALMCELAEVKATIDEQNLRIKGTMQRMQKFKMRCGELQQELSVLKEKVCEQADRIDHMGNS